MISGATRVRIGDAERDAAVSSLGEHFAAGRLTHEEFDERLDLAWAARTQADLDPLFADLPSAPNRPVSGPARTVAFGPAPRVVSRRDRRPRPVLGLLVLVALFVVVVTSVPVVLLVLGLVLLSGMFRGHRGRARGYAHWSCASR
jgi:hypothetical protein